MQARWCFDEDDVPAFDNSTRLRVPGTESVALVLVEATHNSFPRSMTELFGILDIDKHPRADDSEVRKVGVFAVKYLTRCFHLERRNAGCDCTDRMPLS